VVMKLQWIVVSGDGDAYPDDGYVLKYECWYSLTFLFFYFSSSVVFCLVFDYNFFHFILYCLLNLIVNNSLFYGDVKKLCFK
jgi:hypothetical protein